MSAEQPYASPSDLTRFILDEIFIALKQPPHGVARRIFEPLLKLPARRFAVMMAEVDRWVALNGIVAAAQWLLTQIVTGIDARGTEHIPASGPVLVASNHPGAYDIVALIAAIGERPTRTSSVTSSCNRYLSVYVQSLPATIRTPIFNALVVTARTRGAILRERSATIALD